MPHVPRMDLFVEQWTSTTKSCLDRMEPQDRRTTRSFRTYEDVIEHVFVDQDEEPNPAALQELALLRPRLIDLKNFSEFFAAELGQKLDAGIFWGMLGLLLTVRELIMRLTVHCEVVPDI